VPVGIGRRRPCLRRAGVELVVEAGRWPPRRPSFWKRGPLVFSAITGGTQTQHWRGGGVGRSLILLAFLFTSQTGIVASH